MTTLGKEVRLHKVSGFGDGLFEGVVVGYQRKPVSFGGRGTKTALGNLKRTPENVAGVPVTRSRKAWCSGIYETDQGGVYLRRECYYERTFLALDFVHGSHLKIALERSDARRLVRATQGNVVFAKVARWCVRDGKETPVQESTVE